MVDRDEAMPMEEEEEEVITFDEWWQQYADITCAPASV